MRIGIKPQISGIISEVYKEAGETVKKGEIIAKVKVIPELGSLNIEKPANHQTYILRHPVRTIGLHRPSELLYGAAGYTIRLVMGRYIGFGYSANRHIIGLHRLSYPLYRLHTNRHSRCFGTCDSLIFRCYAVP